MAEPPNVRLTVSNQPENVVLVREMLSGLADTIGLDGNDLNDIRTAVTEACNNVVIHAYEGSEGPLQVEVFVSTTAIEVVVRDHGTGIRPRIRSAEEESALGIGLSIIQSLAPRVEFNDLAGNGTEVRMEFATHTTRELNALAEDGHDVAAIEPSELASTSALAVAPGSLAREVLPRVMCVFAARADFSTDRISDAELVADALAAQAGASGAVGLVSVSVRVEPRNLQLRVGPLSAGAAQRLIVDSAMEGLGGVLEKLTDAYEVASDGSSEMLELRLTDSHR
jgi:serine/threonine-protein kinase RsbW